MREQEFGRFILEAVKKDERMAKWYDKNLKHKPFEGTVDKLVKATYDDGGLSTSQAITLSLFIGFTTAALIRKEKSE